MARKLVAGHRGAFLHRLAHIDRRVERDGLAAVLLGSLLLAPLRGRHRHTLLGGGVWAVPRLSLCSDALSNGRALHRSRSRLYEPLPLVDHWLVAPVLAIDSPALPGRSCNTRPLPVGERRYRKLGVGRSSRGLRGAGWAGRGTAGVRLGGRGRGAASGKSPRMGWHLQIHHVPSPGGGDADSRIFGRRSRHGFGPGDDVPASILFYVVLSFARAIVLSHTVERPCLRLREKCLGSRQTTPVPGSAASATHRGPIALAPVESGNYS